MGKIMKRKEIADALYKKTNFYKKNMLKVVDAFAEIVIENLQSATLEEDSSIQIAPGIYIIGHRVPDRAAKDPRTGEDIISPEKVIPRAEFKASIRHKLFDEPKGYMKKGEQQPKKKKSKKKV